MSSMTPHDIFAHQQIEIALPKISVDKGIEPLIKWLNKIPEIHTLYSCRGTFGPNGKPIAGKRAYVLFSCHRNDLSEFMREWSRTGIPLGSVYAHHSGARLEAIFQDGSLNWSLTLERKDFFDRAVKYARERLKNVKTNGISRT